jgi:hypothetical protein
MARREPIFEAALAMALDKVGGEITYSLVDYQAMQARRGRVRVTTAIDDSTNPPTVTVKLAPAPAKAGDRVT